jgi:hypothetical protein
MQAGQQVESAVQLPGKKRLFSGFCFGIPIFRQVKDLDSGEKCLCFRTQKKILVNEVKRRKVKI